MKSKTSDTFNHLTDWIDEKEKTKKILNNGLLSFLKCVEEVEDEKTSKKKKK